MPTKQNFKTTVYCLGGVSWEISQSPLFLTSLTLAPLTKSLEQARSTTVYMYIYVVV